MAEEEVRPPFDAVRVTDRPWKGRTVSGYGGALPTPYLLRVNGHWHRLKVMCYANSGSAYIVISGEIVFINGDDVEAMRDAQEGRV